MRNLTCIVCPIGCSLEIDDCGSLSVTGNGCPRGAVYALEEIREPKRVVTATCLIDDAQTTGAVRVKRAPVKTASPCPREKIPALLDDIYKLRLSLPVKAGDAVISRWNGEDIDVVATRTIE